MQCLLQCFVYCLFDCCCRVFRANIRINDRRKNREDANKDEELAKQEGSNAALEVEKSDSINATVYEQDRHISINRVADESSVSERGMSPRRAVEIA
jgi:hypothetical protein